MRKYKKQLKMVEVGRGGGDYTADPVLAGPTKMSS